MKYKGKALLVLGLALLIALALAAPALAGPDTAATSNVAKVTLVHYPAGKVLIKPAGKPAPKTDSDSYKLLRVKWDVSDLPVPFTLATSGWPSSTGFPSSKDVGAEMEAALEAWDASTKTELFDDTIDIDSKGEVGPKRDYTNTISFGPVAYAGALAVTTYWYDRRAARMLEADIEFSTAYSWGIDTDGEGTGFKLGPSTFDVRNVGTHEVGHVVGLADLYRTTQSELTMYGYASPAETLKWSLAFGDIAGVQHLYGE